MNYLDQIFGYYDKLFGNLPITAQAVISLAFLIFLIWQIIMIFKSGHWIFIALLIFFMPGTWPATKNIGHIFILILKFLLVRAQMILS